MDLRRSVDKKPNAAGFFIWLSFLETHSPSTLLVVRYVIFYDNYRGGGEPHGNLVPCSCQRMGAIHGPVRVLSVS